MEFKKRYERTRQLACHLNHMASKPLRNDEVYLLALSNNGWLSILLSSVQHRKDIFGVFIYMYAESCLLHVYMHRRQFVTATLHVSALAPSDGEHSMLVRFRLRIFWRKNFRGYSKTYTLSGASSKHGSNSIGHRI